MLCLSGFELYSRWVPLKISKLESVPNLLSVNVGCNDDAGVEGIPEWTPEVFSLTSSEKRTNC